MNVTILRPYEERYIEELKELFNVNFKRPQDVTPNEQVLLPRPINDVIFTTYPATWAITGDALFFNVISNQPPNLILQATAFSNPDEITIVHSNELLLVTTPKIIIPQTETPVSTVSTFSEGNYPIDELYETNEEIIQRIIQPPRIIQQPTEPTINPPKTIQIQNLINTCNKNSEDIKFILKHINPNNNPITSLQLEEPK